jgi:hypothetical protein
VYKDGVELFSRALTRTIPPASTVRGHHYVAKSRYNDDYFDGDIASLHFWSRALS